LHQLKLQFPGVKLVDLLLGVGLARDKGGHRSERSQHPETQLSVEREEEIKIGMTPTPVGSSPLVMAVMTPIDWLSRQPIS
jgi:hypothetical protein